MVCLDDGGSVLICPSCNAQPPAGVEAEADLYERLMRVESAWSTRALRLPVDKRASLAVRVLRAALVAVDAELVVLQKEATRADNFAAKHGRESRAVVGKRDAAAAKRQAHPRRQKQKPERA